jgi:hypothetical protein
MSRQEDPEVPAELVGRLLTTGYVVALAAVAVQSVAHVANGVFFDDEIGAFNADHDASVFAWASAAATVAAAFVLFLFWLVTRGAGRLLVVAVVLAFFSLDDVVRIHERLADGDPFRRLRAPDRVGPARLARDLPPAAHARVRRPLAPRGGAPGRVGSALRLGLVLLVAAVAAEVVSAPLYISGADSGWPGRVEVVLEEGAELAGWTIVAAGLTCLLADALVRARPRRLRAR